MKLIIAGGRDYTFSPADIINLDKLNERIKVDEVVSGQARGADTCGELWAKSLGIPVKQFPADWEKYGKQAGFIRNAEMAQYADAVVLFPGGKGTEHMYNIARKHKLTIYDWR
ncbi:hypothetical protein LCGC14_1723590 [marine sediment metagenome]|uniref:YspA cpYpsA-related SLOG domain-containing protein n=1 Tax=marine sediment metagenome TaxID=412755 RepID=A0A0F9KBD6_9ZZZZ